MNPPPAVSFRTIEISDPRFESENLREITVKSPSLGSRADITIFVPPETRGRTDVPLIMLLHGIYGSHWAWVRQAGAHRIAGALIAAGELPPCVLAMPSDGLWGDGSGYLPHRTQDFERWIVDDVPAAVRRAAPCTDDRSPMCIAGLSMGGFGALRLAARHASRFVAASGHSSATRVSDMRDFVAEPLADLVLPGEVGTVIDAVLQNRGRLPALRFDCGTEDHLCEANRTLHRELTDARIEHRYEEFPGGHTWSYWEKHLPDTLRFFAAHLARQTS